MGNVASTVARRTPKKRPAKKKKKKDVNSANATAAAPSVPKFTVTSKACTYNAATNHWRCVHRKASTANTLNTNLNNNWNGFWVNDMPYAFDDDAVNMNNTKSKKKKKTKVT